MPARPHNDAAAIFEILVRENSNMLSTYLRSIVWEPAAVDDLFQETMLTAWRKLADYDRTRPFGPWLRGIASRLVMAHHRKSRRDMMVCNQTVIEHLDRSVQHISARHGDTWDEKIATLRQCIEALPDPQRQVIGMRYQDDRTLSQIAEHLDLPYETLKKRLQRARSQLLDCLKRKQMLPETSP